MAAYFLVQSCILKRYYQLLLFYNDNTKNDFETNYSCPTLSAALGVWISQFTTLLRTLDALHLAVASHNNIKLVTADTALAATAQFLGVDILLLQ
jgi:PIN domain